jgi:hypothetical protein
MLHEVVERGEVVSSRQRAFISTPRARSARARGVEALVVEDLLRSPARGGAPAARPRPIGLHQSESTSALWRNARSPSRQLRGAQRDEVVALDEAVQHPDQLASAPTARPRSPCGRCPRTRRTRAERGLPGDTATRSKDSRVCGERRLRASCSSSWRRSIDRHAVADGKQVHAERVGGRGLRGGGHTDWRPPTRGRRRTSVGRACTLERAERWLVEM